MGFAGIKGPSGLMECERNYIGTWPLMWCCSCGVHLHQGPLIVWNMVLLIALNWWSWSLCTEARSKVMRRQSTFVFHHTSHPWSRSRVLIWMESYSWVLLSILCIHQLEKNLLLCINTMECIWTKIIYSYFLYELHRILPLGGCGSHYTLMGSIPVNGQILCSCSNYRGSHTNCIFLCFITRHCCLLLQLCFVRQFGSSIQKSDYLALRLGFITVGTQCFGFPFLLFSLSLPSICEFLLLVRYISFLTGI